MPPSSRLARVYATDEDIVSIAAADYANLVPKSARVAYGTDGLFIGTAPWVLISTSVNFLSQGVTSGMICQLTQPKSAFRGAGDLLACDSATSNSVTFRRVGQMLGWGQAPSPLSGVVGVEFTINTLANQIEDVSYLLDERFSVDPNVVNRTPDDIYDLRIMRRLVVYQVILRQYAQETRTPDWDFSEKIKHYEEKFREELDVATIRWGPTGQSQQSTNRFGTRMVR